MNDADPRHHRQFVTTRWSRVLAAGQVESNDADAALSELCELYWYPLYAYLRRGGYQPDDAAELIQGFLTQLISDHALRTADPERGRFRSFMLTLLKRYVAREYRQAAALKRGGGRVVRSLDVEDGERRYQSEPADSWTAERLYERRWALTLLDRVAEELAQRYAADGKAALFEELKVFLTPGNQTPTHADIASRLDMSAAAVKVAVHRLRGRYRDLLAAEVRHTLASDGDVADEMMHLIRALRGEP